MPVMPRFLCRARAVLSQRRAVRRSCAAHGRLHDVREPARRPGAVYSALGLIDHHEPTRRGFGRHQR
jgi:hypothetical protein